MRRAVRRVENHLLLTADCAHCRCRIVQAPQLGWAHTVDPDGETDGAIAVLALMCAHGQNVASPQVDKPIHHVSLSLDDGLTMADVIQEAVPMPLSEDLLDDLRPTYPMRGLLVALIVGLIFWAVVAGVIAIVIAM